MRFEIQISNVSPQINFTLEFKPWLQAFCLYVQIYSKILTNVIKIILNWVRLQISSNVCFDFCKIMEQIMYVTKCVFFVCLIEVVKNLTDYTHNCFNWLFSTSIPFTLAMSVKLFLFLHGIQYGIQYGK